LSSRKERLHCVLLRRRIKDEKTIPEKEAREERLDYLSGKPGRQTQTRIEKKKKEGYEGR